MCDVKCVIIYDNDDIPYVTVLERQFTEKIFTHILNSIKNDDRMHTRKIYYQLVNINAVYFHNDEKHYDSIVSVFTTNK